MKEGKNIKLFYKFSVTKMVKGKNTIPLTKGYRKFYSDKCFEEVIYELSESWIKNKEYFIYSIWGPQYCENFAEPHKGELDKIYYEVTYRMKNDKRQGFAVSFNIIKWPNSLYETRYYL